MKKMFTRISSLLTVALAICWGSGVMAQNTCATAIPATACTAFTGSTVGTGNDTGGGACPTGTGGQQWYTYTPASSGSNTITFCTGTTYDSWVSIYTGTCGAFTCVGFNDDFCGLQSQMTWAATGGTQYYIRVGGFSTSEGTYTFTISANPGCTDPGAANYDPTALCDNGSCVYCNGGEIAYTMNFFDAFGDGWNGGQFLIINTQNASIVYQGTLANGSSGNAAVCLPAGCYSITVTSGTFPSEISWQFLQGGNIQLSGGAPANIGFSVGGANCTIPGCTNPTCNNYNPSANVDDGSCQCPPANDDCSAPDDIFCGSSISGSLLYATDDAGSFSGNCGIAATAGVWYQFIGTGDQVTLSLCASGWDTKIHVFTGTCGSLTCLAANDDACGLSSSITFTSVNGQVYLILVNRFSPFTPNNDFTLDVTCQSCPGAPAPNDDCATALSMNGLSGVPFSQSLCCTNPDNSVCLGFQTGYGTWFYMNSNSGGACGEAESFDVLIENTSGTNVGMTIYEDLGNIGCSNLVAIACCPIVTGSCGGDLSSFYTLSPSTDYYFLAYTTDPNGCGDIQFTSTLGFIGCMDPTAINYDPCANIDDGLCDFTGVTQPNDLCVNATPLPCGGSLLGSTGGSTATDFDPACGPPPAVFGTPGLDCAQAGYTFAPGDPCATAVCGYDSFCCNVFWDGFCASEAAVDPNCTYCVNFGAPIPGAGVWYELPVGTGDTWTVSLCGSVIDSYLSIYQGTCGAMTGCVGTEAGDFIACGFFDQDDPEITFISNPGQTYYAYVMTEGPNTQFVITLDCVPTIFGCMNNAACNYDPNANWDDGNCDFLTCACDANPGGTGLILNMFDLFGDGWNGAFYEISDNLNNVVVATGSCSDADYVVDQDNFLGCESGLDVLCLNDGCYTITLTAGSFPSEVSWNLSDGTNIIALGGAPASVDFFIGGECGCTNAAACNYNANAVVDDGSCCFGTCATINVTAGFFPSEQTWNVTDENGDIIASGGAPFSGELCLTGCNFSFNGFDAFGDGWDLGGFVISDLGTNTTLVNGTVSGTSGVFPFTPLGCGCTDNTACNYDASATADDGSCCYQNCVTILMFDAFGDGWNGGSYAISEANSGLLLATGTLQNGSFGADIFCLPDGCYSISVGGSTFDSEVSWQIIGANGSPSGGSPTTTLFSVGSGNCTPGCTTSIACNYDANAGLSDCTLCDFASCVGCTYDCADNFDPSATIDDGSCVGCQPPCPADLDENGVVNVSDLLIFMSAFGTFC